MGNIKKYVRPEFCSDSQLANNLSALVSYAMEQKSEDEGK